MPTKRSVYIPLRARHLALRHFNLSYNYIGQLVNRFLVFSARSSGRRPNFYHDALRDNSLTIPVSTPAFGASHRLRLGSPFMVAPQTSHYMEHAQWIPSSEKPCQGRFTSTTLPSCQRNTFTRFPRPPPSLGGPNSTDTWLRMISGRFIPMNFWALLALDWLAVVASAL
jgi:hypothetical protein